MAHHRYHYHVINSLLDRIPYFRATSTNSLRAGRTNGQWVEILMYCIEFFVAHQHHDKWFYVAMNDWINVHITSLCILLETIFFRSS